MQTIVKPADVISLVIGEQKINEEKTQYRLLHFCLPVEHNGDFLLYNNLTKELLALSKEEWQKIKNGTYDLNDSFIREMVEKWFLVPCDNDDLKLSKQVTDLARAFHSDNSITSFDILTTTACNARCFYCFESDVIKKTMTSDTAKAVSEYIIKKSNGKAVTIRWFGGEPLFNMPVIDIISSNLQKNGIEYKSTMVSNGYLFDDETILKAKNLWNLKNVQITLDGNRDTYNRIKNYIYKNDNNPFKRVIDNIGKLLENDITVNIRLNMDNYNSEELYGLVDYLHSLFAGKKGLSIYSKMLFENAGEIKTVRTDPERDKLACEHKKLGEYIEKLGFRAMPSRLTSKIKISHCMADSKKAVMISPDGRLGNCEHHIDDDFFGNIFSDTPVKAWSDYKDDIEKCSSCVYYPTCMELKRCSTHDHECFDFEKEEKISKLKLQIAYTYDKIIAGENESAGKV